jgi:hypothetical protein
MSFIENPFLNNRNTFVHYDENLGQNVELDQMNIAKYYQSVYLLLKKNNQIIPPEFYNYQIPREIFDEVSRNLVIHKTSAKILKNKKHFDSLTIMSSEQLKQYNIFNYELEDKILVVPIFNITYHNILNYLGQYESNDTLENVYKVKVLNQYFDVDENNFKINQFFSEKINNMEETKYWTNYYNCLINMTTIFRDRQFSLEYSRISDKNISNLLKTLIEEKVIKKSTNENYLKELELADRKILSTKDDYVDVASTIKKNGFQPYRISKKSEFTNSDINQIFSVLTDKQKFLMFSNLMVSKKYCHLVVNNKTILEQMAPTINKFAPLYRYLLSYSWIRFYMEECIKKSFIKTTDEFIFDIDTVSKLPVYPFDYNNLKNNPYMPIFVSDAELKPENNICGIYDYIEELSTQERFCDLEGFKTRFNIFCTGNPTNNLFEGFDFEKNNVGITGSVMTACILKNHPLMSNFNIKNSLTEKLNRYFNEYYCNSDIDIMVLTKDNYKFIDTAKELHNQVILNLCKFNGYIEPSCVKLICNKIGYVFVSDKFINENIQLDESMKQEKQDKVEYIMDRIDEPEIKKLFEPYYKKLLEEKMSNMFKEFSSSELEKLENKYPEIFNKNIEFKIYISRYQKDSKNQNLPEFNFRKTSDIDLEFTYKYKIESPYLIHNMEIFPVKYDDFFGVVGRFHLPCVRAYYNDSNVYLTPSCISANMTFMNLDYKYMTGTKDPLDIINKNRTRGFGTWLNSKEKKVLAKYCKGSPYWSKLYNLSDQNQMSENQLYKLIFGPQEIKSRIFKPRLFCNTEYNNSVYVDTNNYRETIPAVDTIDNDKKLSNLFKCLQIKQIDYSSFRAINKKGQINPLKKWLINATWEIYETEHKPFENKQLRAEDDSDDEPKEVVKKAVKVKKPLIAGNSNLEEIDV